MGAGKVQISIKSRLELADLPFKSHEVEVLAPEMRYSVYAELQMEL